MSHPDCSRCRSPGSIYEKVFEKWRGPRHFSKTFQDCGRLIGNFPDGQNKNLEKGVIRQVHQHLEQRSRAVRPVTTEMGSATGQQT